MTRPSSGISRAVESPLVTAVLLPGRFRAVLFDMDGLLIDSEPLWIAAETELLERHGVAFTDADRVESHGRALQDSVRAYSFRVPDVPPAQLEAELLDLIRGHYAAGAPLHPGAAELVRALSGRVRLGVASSTPSPLVRIALGSVGLLDAFEIVASGADLGAGKPDPAVFLDGCRRLETDPLHAIAFEDSPVGVRAARAAGLFVVGVPDREGVAERLLAAGADVLVDSLEDVIVEGV
jgi:HAD superfamily hydrolase (TIGR01509 family)